MSLTKASQFIREVRQEATKVTWPTRKETTISTSMVFLMVLIMGVFFLLVDQLILLFLSAIGIGG